MADLSEILEEEIFNLCKKVPEAFQFTSSLLQSETSSRLGMDTIFSFYDMCNKFLILMDLYEKSNPVIQKEQKFKELKNQVIGYKSGIREYLLDVFE